ncbi:Uncharacterised protein [Clostridioides difficile]|uniref:hypothetical protein n=1 Tax=Clostridioides difficile TaxID=1496 RepID=UPI00102686C7|nr:hypothetical protein [Clostridioides difficile]UWD43012.1 hypothetical protein NYF05_08560 [Clostridioides difficile]UWD46602.1 hypothetical protein NYU56_08310 [Clostridioides difficile]VFF94056.1 Uncharacterised protein [Clostridioides difficile]VIF99831.1 Uncharacterised protein [Clostridioides difficile]HBF4438673.1 hypothetical protein [Clostridioides difficile]
MREKKILDTIPKLQTLTESELDLIITAVDSCVVVQTLMNTKSSKDFTNKLSNLFEVGRENTKN